MQRRNFMKLTGGSVAALTLRCGASDTQSPVASAGSSLYEKFQNPDAEARPFVRWWWNGAKVTEQEILRELDLLHQAGMGGVEINTIAFPEGSTETGDPALPWLSAEWNRMIKIASDGCRERGMIADLIVGSGWPFGGRFLESGETIQGVALNKISLQGPTTRTGRLSEIMKPPPTRNMVENMPDPELKFLRLVPEGAGGLDDCIALEDAVTADGSIRIQVPSGRHTLYVGTWRESYTAVHHGAPGSDGQVLNHYNKDAVEKYLNHMSDILGPVLGGSLGDGLRAVFCDSIELSESNWTTDFEVEFEKRRSYKLTPWLHFVIDYEPTGATPEFNDQIRRVRYDFHRTMVELFHERFIHVFHQWCRQNGVLSRYQAYGSPFLMGMLTGYMVPDIPEGDTWIFPHPPIGEPLDGIRYAVWNKYASSGGHLSGKRIVAC